MDSLTPAQRHRCMSHIRSRDTKPELAVRQWLWRRGYRYRLNVKSVPGSPDIVLRTYRTAIFVNGCFWHGHNIVFEKPGVASAAPTADAENETLAITDSQCCRIPKTNRDFWANKILRNCQRDQHNYQLLADNGWQVIVVWECQLKPKLIENTMRLVELRLNECFLAIHKQKIRQYELDDAPLATAAESETQYGNS